MRRSTIGSMAVLAIFAVGLVTADDSKIKNLKDKNCCKATITKVDSDKSAITLTTCDKDGKKIEKSMPLAFGAEYFDTNGKAAKIDDFKQGDHVLATEKDGKITDLKKCNHHSQAKITKVDTKKGTVTATAKDKDGKDTEMTFQLVDDAEYFDSTGRVATVEVFRSGDEVLIVEREGKIVELKKDPGPASKKPLSK